MNGLNKFRKRNPDLYILHYGTNESVNAKMSMDKYKQGLRQVIKRFKYALPKSACLLVSPMDRGKKDEKTGKIKKYAHRFQRLLKHSVRFLLRKAVPFGVPMMRWVDEVQWLVGTMPLPSWLVGT